MKHWQRNNTWQHWTRHSLIPVTVLLLLLAIPQKWLFTVQTQKAYPTLEIELSPIPNKPTSVTQKIDATIEQEQIKPALSEVTKAQPVKTESMTQRAIKPRTVIKKKETIQPAKPLTADQVQLMLSKTPELKLEDKDFMARSNDNLFLVSQATASDWRADLPYLDESIDAPRLEMQFYSAGYSGSIERFFDKVTYKKTFTTQYGTKIHCALVGVIALCGWK